MRAVVQRVGKAQVEVDQEIIGKIGRGLLVYLGIEKGDGEPEVSFMVDKVLHLRIFPDADGKMNLSVRDINGAVLSISQFTLASHIKKGRRPDFNNAEVPEKAEKLYDLFNDVLGRDIQVEKGLFGAMMEISSVNEGPVTIIIEKKYKE